MTRKSRCRGDGSGEGSLQVNATPGFFLARPANVTALALAGAVAATNRVIALLDQRMERQVVLADIGITLLAGHVDHRVELDHAATLFKNFQAGAMIRLPAHQAGNPQVEIFLGFLE